MRKRIFLQVSVTALATFLIFGCAKKKGATGQNPEKRTVEVVKRKTLNKGAETAGKARGTSKLWQISTGSGYYSFPAWSPDGKKIAYTDYQDGKQNILVVEVGKDGRPKGTPVNITNSHSIDEHPSWSPDGKKLVFDSNRDGGKRELFVIDANGDNPKLLYRHQTKNGLKESFHPSWSPDGEIIAFVAENNIWVIGKEGKNSPVRITSFGYNDYPSWSPDGTQIAFYSNNAIKLIKADGSENPKTLTGTGGLKSNFPGWSSFPAWSPDGKKIAFVSNRKKMLESKEVKYYDLWIVNADGTGKAEYLTNDRHRESFPAWSPQGDKLAFQSNRNNGFYIWGISLPANYSVAKSNVKNKIKK
ncbi:MAG: hypothetical protein GXO98_01975 [Nitrospirae bacterium]|nr:hypothetical protein [Nitrospirota bacterium]